jgi:hypothetical protein
VHSGYARSTQHKLGVHGAVMCTAAQRHHRICSQSFDMNDHGRCIKNSFKESSARVANVPYSCVLCTAMGTPKNGAKSSRRPERVCLD